MDVNIDITMFSNFIFLLLKNRLTTAKKVEKQVYLGDTLIPFPDGPQVLKKNLNINCTPIQILQDRMDHNFMNAKNKYSGIREKSNLP